MLLQRYPIMHAVLPGVLDADEVEAISQRAYELVNDGILPIDHSGHRYPWPLV